MNVATMRDIERVLSQLTSHHVGSTSVPGLCAKPRIDVDIVVRRAEEIPDAINRLREAGYEFRGNRYNDGMWPLSSLLAFVGNACTFVPLVQLHT